MNSETENYQIDKQAALLVYQYRMKVSTNDDIVHAINNSQQPNLLIAKLRHHAGSYVFIPAISQS